MREGGYVMEYGKEQLKSFISNSQAAFMNDQLQQAFSLAQEAIKLDENCADAYQCAGDAYMSLGHYLKVVYP